MNKTADNYTAIREFLRACDLHNASGISQGSDFYVSYIANKTLAFTLKLQVNFNTQNCASSYSNVTIFLEDNQSYHSGFDVKEQDFKFNKENRMLSISSSTSPKHSDGFIIDIYK